MVDIINDVQLAQIMSALAETAISNVSDKVLQLLKENIVKYVYEYDYPPPNKNYYNGSGQPTYQFLNSFKWEPIKNNITNVTRMLYYDWQSLAFDESTFLHGDPVRGDQRQQLAEALDVSGFDNGFFGGKLRGNYWKETLDDLLSGTLNDWFRIEMQAMGFIRV